MAIFVSYEDGGLRVFSFLVHFLVKKFYGETQKSVLNMASSDIHIDEPQLGHPKRAELPDININTGAQSINTERASSRKGRLKVPFLSTF